MDVGGGAGWFHQELLLLEPGEIRFLSDAGRTLTH